MKIYVKNNDGTVHEAIKTDNNQYTFITENKAYYLTLTEANGKGDDCNLTEDQKAKITKAIFSNEDVLDQLRDARKNRDRDFSYYSGDENEFDKLIDEVNNDK
ncbi:hypothetical protein [Bacillus sp. REN16]|uniref:hypothetical protein n=1 Tax=Bacillus sp. REN16 TaxID=2887296 RepID=UPI001E313FFC|nr:hypothetical protein [Bacillus sp. REN16]MCC3359264.1 hypothetical protein [Bacillus sp. REN16]